jgi:hypothetical protein
VKQKYPALFLLALITSTTLFFSACKKLNDSTELGGDLIPEVDNIHTFDTILTIEGFNDIFQDINDSIFSNGSDEHFLGRIDNDPIFGKTDARLSLELKPSRYKFGFINRPDSLHIDSIVLALDYIETYGDTVMPQTISVYEIDPSSQFSDTANYLIRKNYITKSGLLGSTTIAPQSLKDSVRVFNDTVANQLRIKLDNSFGTRLLAYDSTGNGAYSSDSLFQSFFKGFTLESSGGNAIMGFNLAGAKTRLEIYYKDDNNDAPLDKWDTAVANFGFVSGSSGAANYVSRDYSGTPLQAAQGGATPDDILYIQNTPGTFASLKIPGLTGLTNRVVHRAELIAEQLHDISDTLFPAPAYLFLDAFDAVSGKNLTVPYDLAYDMQNSLNFGSFGLAPYNMLDGLGNVVRTWRFNITRYVQHVANGTSPVYDFRLTSPFYLRNVSYNPGGNLPAINYPSFPIIGNALSPINPSIARGRVRLIGSTGQADTNPRRLRVRIIYSKI